MLGEQVTDDNEIRPAMEIAINRTIRKVGDDIENLKFNTAIAAMMALLNDLSSAGGVTRAEYAVLLQLLNPFAPHMTEELWEMFGYEGTLDYRPWPVFDPSKCEESTVEIAVQVNGKIRDRLNVAVDASSDDVIALAKAQEKIAAELDGKQIVKELYIPRKLVNLVVKPL